jgi:hypothetical protein
MDKVVVQFAYIRRRIDGASTAHRRRIDRASTAQRTV